MPKSARVSISASAVPVTMAGRASGMATWRKEDQALRPKVRLTSSAQTDWLRKAVRAKR